MAAQQQDAAGRGRMIYVPLCYQQTPYNCGVACVQSILKCYGLNYFQDELAGILGTKPVTGTDPAAIVRLFRRLGFSASLREGMRVGDVRALIDRGHTPLLLIQAWPEEPADFAADKKDNHYVIACGYGPGILYFMDPFVLGHYAYLPERELPPRWHVKDSIGNELIRSGIAVKTEHCAFEYDPMEIVPMG